MTMRVFFLWPELVKQISIIDTMAGKVLIRIPIIGGDREGKQRPVWQNRAGTASISGIETLPGQNNLHEQYLRSSFLLLTYHTKPLKSNR